MTSLLIGNGINYLGANVVGWTDLLNKLITKIDESAVITMEEKPFLHLYEEIFTRAEKYTSKNEKDIKQDIVNEISTMIPNPYHKKITDLAFKNILTLNYNYNFTDGRNRELLKQKNHHPHNDSRVCFPTHLYCKLEEGVLGNTPYRSKIIKNGYKEMEIEIIPDDWEVVKKYKEVKKGLLRKLLSG